MRRANEAIIHEKHPIPNIDDILYSLNGSTMFSKIDLKSSFYQIELYESSRHITTFCSILGLFRYKRLMFGISCAPEIHQHIIQLVISKCKDIYNIHDDIIVTRKDEKDHDENLLQCLDDNRLTVYVEKCVMRQPLIQFMGHYLSKNEFQYRRTKSRPFDKHLSLKQFPKYVVSLDISILFRAMYPV